MDRYFSFDTYCKTNYGRKLYKLALDGGMTCPNRDGHIASGGCIFCSSAGSGDYAVKCNPCRGGLPAEDAITEAIRRLGAKASVLLTSDEPSFIAYLQSFTNTYAPAFELKSIYEPLLRDRRIAGLSIATRPDCLEPDVLTLLKTLRKDYPDKFLWVELGFQTAHEETARYIRRGYDNEIASRAVYALHELGIPVIVHIILGLPYPSGDGFRIEGPAELSETIHYVNQLPISGIKLQLLHILKHTDLAGEYKNGSFRALSPEEYVDDLCFAIAHLRPDIVIHRLTGDGAPDQLIAPLFSLHKHQVLNTIRHELKERNISQGCALEQEVPKVNL